MHPTLLSNPELETEQFQLETSAPQRSAACLTEAAQTCAMAAPETTPRRWTVVLISRDYPPLHGGGIATFVHALAHALQGLGHQVHVICRAAAEQASTQDENGVQVHRIVERGEAKWHQPHDARLPNNVWRWSVSAYRETERIADSGVAIDLVEAPIWGCEGIAFLLRRRWPLVTSLHTTLHTWMESNPRKANNWFWQQRYGRPMLALEKRLMSEADAVRANSQAILREIEAHYGFNFDPGSTQVVPHGLPTVKVIRQRPMADSTLELLFVGRLEQRKGIGELLQVLPDLLPRWPQLNVRLIGDARIRNAAGSYDKDDFLARHQQAEWLTRVHFEGRVDDTVLLQAYADCDIFVAPSLFESFGLVFVEAMRQGKPVIGCEAGGMPEVIDKGRTGLLVPPGDSASLLTAIERLLREPALRAQMGVAALQSYQLRFTAQRMALNSLPLYLLAWRRHQKNHMATAPAGGRPLRISYLSATCKRHDAISNAVVQEIRWLRSQGHHVHLYTHSCNQDDVAYTRVKSVGDFCLHEHFQRSDLIVCHFGIYFELFNAILCAPVKAKVLVVFHNITPKEFVAPQQHAVIDRSFAQMTNLRHADHVICVSPTNLKVMHDAGINVASTVLPLAVPGQWSPPQSKPSEQDGIVRLLFVGRFVASKGLDDLMQALRLLLDHAHTSLPVLELCLVGNLTFSDRSLVEQIRQTAQDLEQQFAKRLSIRLLFGISDSAKRDLMAAANLFVLPTYHEGFCVPIVEAISSGCRVVVYDNSNTPAISQGLADLVPTGDVQALAQRMRQVIAEVAPGPQTQQGYASYREQAERYAQSFQEDRVKERFLEQIQLLCTQKTDALSAPG